METRILFIATLFSANVSAQVAAVTPDLEDLPDKMKISANDQSWQAKDPYAQDSLKDLLWQKEVQYWHSIKSHDFENYHKLWDENFVGYPNHNKESDKAYITDWLTEMKVANSGSYDYRLTRKVENVFGDTIIVFYDVSQRWMNAKNKVVKSNTLQIIHTWKKRGDDWLIIGGMVAIK